MSRTEGNSNLYIMLGTKGDGKTTIGTYLMHRLNKPSVVFDVAKQFDKRDYRIFCYSVDELKYHLNNKHWRQSFYKGKLQIIYRPKNLKEDIEEACKILADVHGILIYFEEMELYANQYLTNKSPIFDICYLMRNRRHTVIVVAKQAGKLSGLIKDLGDYFFIGQLRTRSALGFFDDVGGKALTERIKNTRKGDFLILDGDGGVTPFKLSSKIAKLI